MGLVVIIVEWAAYRQFKRRLEEQLAKLNVQLAGNLYAIFFPAKSFDERVNYVFNLRCKFDYDYQVTYAQVKAWLLEDDKEVREGRS